MRVLYAEDVTTLNQQAGTFGAFGALNIGTLGGLGQLDLLGLNNFLTNRVFLQKRFNAAIALTGSRNDISLNIFSLSDLHIVLQILTLICSVWGIFSSLIIQNRWEQM